MAEVSSSVEQQVIQVQKGESVPGDKPSGNPDVNVSINVQSETGPTSPPSDGSVSPSIKAKRPSLSRIPMLRVEQLKEEGCSSPGSSTYNSEDSEFSDTDIISRLGEFVAPTEEVATNIAEQMDFYFSDANILKDSFLLKHVRRNKEGFVNLKLITSFKKMKTLTRDYRVVAFSLRRHSKIMVVNEDGNKARRKVPLPDYDETKTSRTVVVFNLPAEPSPTMESVSNLFKDCGDIVMLQIHKAGKTSVPSDIKKHIARFTDGASVTCAVIEFEKHEQAQKAVAKGVDSDDWKEGLKVLMLASKGKNTIGDDSESDSEFKQKKRNKKKTLRSQALEKEWEGMSSGSEGDFLMPRPRSRNSSFGSDKSYNGKSSPSRSMLSPTSADKTWTSPNGSSISNQRRRSVPLPQSPLAENSKNSPKPSPKPSPRSSPRASPEMRRRANSGGMQKSPPEPSGNSPWVQRRMAASREMSPLAKGAGGRKMEAITRAPRGPEPGKGFYGGKGRGKPLMATQC